MTRICSYLLCVVALAGAVTSSEPATDASPLVEAKLLFRSDSTVVDRILEFGGHLLVVEDNNHRIVVVDQRGNIERQLGSIGQGPGELYYPGDLVRDKMGNLYVFEVRNRRIQIFDPSGGSLRTFSVEPQPYGMAVNSKGEILLGQPTTGKLVSVYSADGRLIRSFGQLRLASDFYGKKLAPLNGSMREAINRINIVCDNADNVYIAFLGAPFWQKYSSEGKLLLERRIEFPDVQRAIAEFSSSFKAHSTVKFDEDKSAIPSITTGMTIDGLHRLLFSVRWDKSWIAVTELDGSNGHALRLQDPNLQIRNISPSNGFSVFALGAKPGHNNEVYSLTAPRFSEDSRKEVNKQ